MGKGWTAGRPIKGEPQQRPSAQAIPLTDRGAPRVKGDPQQQARKQERGIGQGWQSMSLLLVLLWKSQSGCTEVHGRGGQTAHGSSASGGSHLQGTSKRMDGGRSLTRIVAGWGTPGAAAGAQTPYQPYSGGCKTTCADMRARGWDLGCGRVSRGVGKQCHIRGQNVEMGRLRCGPGEKKGEWPGDMASGRDSTKGRDSHSASPSRTANRSRAPIRRPGLLGETRPKKAQRNRQTR